MAWTQAELDALEFAYKSGVTRVKYKDRETEYRSLQEMRSLIDEARREINGTRRRPHTYTSYSRRYQR